MTSIAVVAVPWRPTATDVRWESPELKLGVRADVVYPNAPILVQRRRRQALTTTASGAIG
jgi:hypothetical protein